MSENGTPRTILLRLLDLDRELDRFADKLKDVFKEDVFYQAVDVDLSGVVLDAMGFPPDNTTDFTYEELKDHPDVFCRDWLTDWLQEHIELSAEEKLAWLEGEVVELARIGQ